MEGVEKAQAFMRKAEKAATSSAPPSQAVCAGLQKEVEAMADHPRGLLFSDAAQSPSLVDALGADAEGLEGTAPAPDPTSGFAAAWQARFGGPPPPFAASSYHSWALPAHRLEKR